MCCCWHRGGVGVYGGSRFRVGPWVVFPFGVMHFVGSWPRGHCNPLLFVSLLWAAAVLLADWKMEMGIREGEIQLRHETIFIWVKNVI